MFSTRGRYALRVMVDLAEHQANGYIPLKEVAKRQEISEKYMESVVKALVRNHMLTGMRGKGGGYRLTRQPDQYTVGEVLRVTEGTLAPIPCLEEDAEQCSRMGSCSTVNMWRGLKKVTEEYLDSRTIGDLVAEDQEGNDYVI